MENTCIYSSSTITPSFPSLIPSFFIPSFLFLFFNQIRRGERKEKTDKKREKGSLPDMESSTAAYQTLQQVYRKKAQEDLEKFTEILQEILISFGKDASAIPPDYIEKFVKNANFLRLINTNSIYDEYSSPSSGPALRISFPSPLLLPSPFSPPPSPFSLPSL